MKLKQAQQPIAEEEFRAQEQNLSTKRQKWMTILSHEWCEDSN